MVLSQNILTFNATITRPDPPTQILYVTNSGIDELAPLVISEDAGWLVTWVGGSGNNQRIMNRVDIEGLSVGTYNATVTVSCANATNTPQTYTVILNIDEHRDQTAVEPSIIIWVATTGNDESGTGAQTSPYKTIERALLDFENGNQIRISNGTYTPTDTIMISGMTGSIFAETPGGVTIQPRRTTGYESAIAIVNSDRFTVKGINIVQSASSEHTRGIYANNVNNFVAYNCKVSDFECNADCIGIFASGTGRIENCLIEDLTINNGNLYGIYTDGLHVIDNTIRRLIDRGNSSANGIYIVDDYTPPEPPVPPPPSPDPEACWWTFDGDDELYLSGADGVDFDPQSNSNDFSVVGKFVPLNVTLEERILFCKWGHPTLGFKKSWRVMQAGGSLNCGVTSDGGTVSSLTIANLLDAGHFAFYAMRYEYSGVPGNNSSMWLRGVTYDPADPKDETTSKVNAPGPVHSDINAAVVIGNWDYPAGRYFEGDMYWHAYYNRKLTDAEIDQLEAGTVLPWNVSDLFMCIIFCRDVAGTYQPEYCLGPNAPYIFTVNGNPIKHP
jgi:hypothetical protein